MKTKHTDILIIGAGLTGLTLAYYLKTLDIDVKIIEGRNKLGGRIYTKYNNKQAPIDLGATWLIRQQTSALKLLKSLNIDLFEQDYGNTAIYQPNKMQAAQLVKLPANNNASYRIKNGTYSVIKALSDHLPKDTITLSQKVHTIETINNGLLTRTETSEFRSSYVISTLPPLLFLNTVKTKPVLPQDLQDVILKTHTWMKDSIRVGFTYKNPFWKADKTSGTIYSNASPLQEFYDHSDSENKRYALGGFMNGSFSENTKSARQALALKQLVSYYGQQALQFESYEECIWTDEKLTTPTSDTFLTPQQNNGHPLYQNSYLNNKLFIAGAETSPVFPGKMEGAITSAQFIFNKLKSQYN